MDIFNPGNGGQFHQGFVQQHTFGQPQQVGFGPVFDPAMLGVQQQAMDDRGGGGGGGGVRRRGVARGRGRGRGVQNAVRERVLENLVTTPAFWATVFTTLQNYPNIAEEIRRDVEEQERRAAEARERVNRRRHEEEEHRQSRRQEHARDDYDEEDERSTAAPEPGRPADHVGGNEQEGGLVDEPYEFDRDRPLRGEDLPDLYEFLTNDLNNIRQTVGVQRLSVLMDELDIEALWSARDVVISFGPLTRILLRLFIGPYATDEEKLIVRMLNLAVERASRNYGFEDYQTHRRPQVDTEPFAVTYRRRGRMLRDFAAFRYMLQVTENMGRISRKHKNDLILLYLTLTTPEVRLHRKGNGDDRDNVIAFRDLVTGAAITTPLIMARPMSIEMHLDSVFGNVSMNTRLLERSLSAALTNRNRRANGMNAAQEVELLLENAHLLDLSDGNTNATRATALKPYSIEKENAALRHMLEMSTVVSMMAEEYRVFVAGAPPSRVGGGGTGGGGRTTGSNKVPSSSSKEQTSSKTGRQAYMLRRPIFYTFKPVSQAMANKGELLS